jgi:hypothetical protein
VYPDPVASSRRAPQPPVYTAEWTETFTLRDFGATSIVARAARQKNRASTLDSNTDLYILEFEKMTIFPESVACGLA